MPGASMKPASNRPFVVSELFGPILPIIEVENVDEAIQIVADRYATLCPHVTPLSTPFVIRPYPLVVYIFTNCDEVREKGAFVFDYGD